VFEQCFAYLIWDHFKVKGRTDPLSAQECYTKGMMLADIFRSEHILIDQLDQKTFQERIKFLTAEGIFEYD
jgi:hypothetical protein